LSFLHLLMASVITTCWD